MPRCNINLANGIIWSRRKRLMTYRLIIVYFVMVVLLLISTAGRAVHKTYEGFLYYRQGKELEREFARHHPNNSDLLGHAGGLRKQIKKDAARITSINTALPPSIYTPLPALVLLANQADKTMLHKLSFIQQTDEQQVMLRFDLITPVHSKGSASSTKVFLDKWQNDPVLSQQFPDMSQLQIRRTELAGRPVFITQYEASSKD